MGPDTTWAGINPANITGFGGTQPGNGSGGVQSGVDGTVTTAESANPPLYSPQNPLFWLGVLLLAAGGLFHLSTSASAGPAKASVSI
ncbi:MAG: hypothetical protein ABSF84_02800 [Acidimicrobiales bacterium]|jgi:hypothetical protein